MSTDEEEIFESGRVVADRYRILRLLGMGGMGVVYEAEHIALKKRMALKVLTPERSGQQESISRLLNEARSTASIGHPGIVEIFDVNVEDDVAFIGMELLKGEELSQRIHRDAPLDEATVIRLGVDLADALSAAHEHGITHRDLKPDNIFLVERRRRPVAVKILDFGLAKLSQPFDVDAPQTKSGDILGTPIYMSPEQMLSSKDVDGRTDIYAMGIILYECLAGTPPYSPTSFASLVLMVTQEAPAPLAEARPDISPELVAIVEKAMARDKEDRFQAANALADALHELRGESGDGTRSASAKADGPARAAVGELPGMPSDPLKPKEVTTYPSSSNVNEAKDVVASLEPSVRSAPEPGKRRWFAILALSGVVALVAAMIFFWPDSQQELVTTGGDGGGGGDTAPATGVDTGPAAVKTGDADQAGVRAQDGGAAAAEPPSYRVHFVTTPPGAEIHVDGDARCRAPCDAELGTAAVNVTATLGGHVTAEARMEPPFPESMALTLQPVRRVRPVRPIKSSPTTLPPLRKR